MHMAGGGDAQGWGGGMHVHPVHPPWVRHCSTVPFDKSVGEHENGEPVRQLRIQDVKAGHEAPKSSQNSAGCTK